MGKNLPHVVIVGGGLRGLEAARTLCKARVRITQIDKHNLQMTRALAGLISERPVPKVVLPAASLRRVLPEKEFA